MGITATILYNWIFQKTKHNVLYVLLVGTVLTSFFSSIQTTLTRVMDPNEYDTLAEHPGGQLQQQSILKSSSFPWFCWQA